MVKIILLGVAAVLATLGGSFAAIQLGSKGGQDTVGPPVVVEEAVRLEQFSVPVVRDGKVQGYALAQISFSAAAEDIKASKALLTTVVNEAVFATLFEEPSFDFASLKAVQIAQLSERMLAKANARIGRGAIKKVLVESLMLLDQESVRCRKS